MQAGVGLSVLLSTLRRQQGQRQVRGELPVQTCMPSEAVLLYIHPLPLPPPGRYSLVVHAVIPGLEVVRGVVVDAEAAAVDEGESGVLHAQLFPARRIQLPHCPAEDVHTVFKNSTTNSKTNADQ